MSAHDSGRKRARPPVSSQGVEALLERWVSELERGEPSRPPNRVAPERLPPVEEEPFPPEPQQPEEPERDASELAAPEERGQVAAVRAARAELRVQGTVVTFPREDAQVVLGREGGRLVHRGTVAVRGPCAPSREELAGLGLTGAQARALEFVLTWFGSPFDAVSTDAQQGNGPCWGAWPLSGEALLQALARWKRREPSTFEARLGRLGLEVGEVGQESEGLSVLEVEEGRWRGGREALALLGDDVRLFAALAQAGRERGAQLAQLECIIEHSLHPVLAQAERSAEPSTPAGELFPTPRALALLLYAELRLGRRGSARLVTLVREELGKAGGGERAGQRFASALQAAARPREAAEVRRLLSSPELAEPPAR